MEQSLGSKYLNCFFRYRKVYQVVFWWFPNRLDSIGRTQFEVSQGICLFYREILDFQINALNSLSDWPIFLLTSIDLKSYFGNFMVFVFCWTSTYFIFRVNRIQFSGAAEFWPPLYHQMLSLFTWPAWPAHLDLHVCFSCTTNQLFTH